MAKDHTSLFYYGHKLSVIRKKKKPDRFLSFRFYVHNFPEFFLNV